MIFSTSVSVDFQRFFQLVCLVACVHFYFHNWEVVYVCMTGISIISLPFWPNGYVLNLELDSMYYI